MKQEMNKNSRISSLLSVIFLTVVSLMLFGVGVLWLLKTMGVGELTTGTIASQASIALLAIALFKFNFKEIRNTMNFKIGLKGIILAISTVLGIIAFNIGLAAASRLMNINSDKIDEYTSSTTEAFILDGSLLLMIVMPMIIAPIFEELAFRAGLKKVLVDDSKWKPYQYVIISSLLFGILHVQPGALTFIPVILTAFMGVVNSIIYLKTRNIVIPIISHMMYNLIIIYLASATL